MQTTKQKNTKNMILEKIGLTDEKIKKIQNAIRQKRTEKNVGVALGIFFVAWFVATVFGQELVLGIFFGLTGFIGCFLGLSYQPVLQQRFEMQKAAAELPFVLLSMSVELNLRRPFEKVLEKASQSEFKYIGKEFQTVVFEIRQKGATIQSALSHLGNRFLDTDSKRAIVQLIHAYEQGQQKKRGNALKRIASELLAKQRIAARAFSSKLAVFSLAFIAVSAIVPALFQSFVIIGSSFLDFSFSAEQVLLVTAVGFPVLDLLVLALIRNQTPVFLR